MISEISPRSEDGSEAIRSGGLLARKTDQVVLVNVASDPISHRTTWSGWRRKSVNQKIKHRQQLKRGY